MTKSHSVRRFIVQQVVGGAVVNALLNALLGWLALQPGASWPLWGLPGLAADVVAMAFGIAFGTGLVLTPQLRKQLAAGKVPTPALPAAWVSAFARWPRSGLQRGVNVGVLSVLVFGAPTLLLLSLAGVESIDRGQLTAFKGLFGLLAGAALTPLIALAAAADQHVASAAGAPLAEAS